MSQDRTSAPPFPDAQRTGWVFERHSARNPAHHHHTIGWPDRYASLRRIFGGSHCFEGIMFACMAFLVSACLLLISNGVAVIVLQVWILAR